MRSLTSSLTNAVNALTRRPVVSLAAEDHITHYGNYQAPNAADALHDGCIAADGSIVRVQLTRGASPFAQNFQFQRITNPATSAQWTTWTTFAGGSANMFMDGDCAISNNGGTLRAFAQRGTGGSQVYVWTSTNNGASWTGPAVVFTPPLGALIKGVASGGNDDVFVLYDVTGGQSLGAAFWSGSAWSAFADWGLGSACLYGGGAGLAVGYLVGSYYLVWSDGYALYGAQYNTLSSPAAWSRLPDIAPATNTAIFRGYPRLKYDNSHGLWNLTCIEYDTGAVSGEIYQYPRNRQSADLRHFSSGTISHDLSNCLYGAYILPVNLAGVTGTLLITQAVVQRAAAYASSNNYQYADLSGAVLSYQRVDHVGAPNELIVVLDNAAGALTSLVGDRFVYQPINPNTTLVLSEGYKTGSPPVINESVVVGRYRIQKIIFERTPEQMVLKLVAYDNSRMLDIVNRFQATYVNQTIGYLITEICARAGLFSPYLYGSAQMTNVVPLFVLHSGQTYRQALDNLCQTYHLEYYMDQLETLQFIELQAGDTSQWSYQNEISTHTVGYDDWRGNHVIATGRPPTAPSIVGQMTSGEAYDDIDARLVGVERLVHHVDQKLTTLAQCNSKAAYILAQEQRAQYEWSVSIPANPGLQVLDVVTITDAAMPAGSLARGGTARILQSSVIYDVQQATYEMSLKLEGV